MRRQLSVIDHTPTFVERLKSDHGRRSIDLDATTGRLLRMHRRRQLETRLAIGAGYNDLDLVFARVDGSPLHPDAVAKRFERLVKAAGLPRIRFHDLRHTHCAHLIAADRNAKEISRRLGHASVTFTYDRYGHLMPEADAQAAAAVATLVYGSGLGNK
ncbi:MAG: tyrosine-type recombinase/integrase [Actinomycetota bacterium]|nr:tyrosine-type recombinase/integrase [Actinomycetota bacterium]